MGRLELGVSALFVVLGLTASPFVRPAHAQEAGEIVCMTGVASSGAAHSFTFYTTEARVMELIRRGFSVASCGAAGSSFEEHKRKVCAMAQEAPEPFRRSFATSHGVSLSELCAFASEGQP